jgi:cysteine synthase A
MAHWLLQNEGLFVGSSSALNIAATVNMSNKLKLERKLSNNNNYNNSNSSNNESNKINIITVICDSGSRHLSRFWNPDYINMCDGLVWPGGKEEHSNVIPACLEEFYI